MSWYVVYGDPRWDEDELWTTMGHLYKSGMWFKKKAILQAEGHYNTEKSADGTTDLRTSTITMSYYNTNSSINNSGRPSAADTSKYFFLPSLGVYESGKLHDIGASGCYWSSSAHPRYSHYAYPLCFYSGAVTLYGNKRSSGAIAQPFSNFGNN